MTGKEDGPRMFWIVPVLLLTTVLPRRDNQPSHRREVQWALPPSSSVRTGPRSLQQYREAGLAVANTISAMFNTGLLFFALRRKLKRLEMQGLIGNVMALIGIATVAGGVAYLTFWYWNRHVGHTGLYARIGAVFVPGIIAGVIYWLLALAAKVPAAMEVTNLVRRKLRR